ncbi:hypothetical protein [Candidatus Clostridium radicumherbarum]|uniref:Uncharacterized protein n=1 Tax=Candidatus Clostridium radicumherbarum TaxID=3381662 RepID=A0ABW8TP16_9CLOT
MSKQRKKHNNSNNTNNGFDINNLDLNNIGSLLNNMNPNQLSGLLNNVDINQFKNMFSGSNNGQGGKGNQIGNIRSVELLNAMKPLVNAERSQLIDSIIQLFNISQIMKK